jgi:hypothetical protein
MNEAFAPTALNGTFSQNRPAMRARISIAMIHVYNK